MSGIQNILGLQNMSSIQNMSHIPGKMAVIGNTSVSYTGRGGRPVGRYTGFACNWLNSIRGPTMNIAKGISMQMILLK